MHGEHGVEMQFPTEAKSIDELADQLRDAISVVEELRNQGLSLDAMNEGWGFFTTDGWDAIKIACYLVGEYHEKHSLGQDSPTVTFAKTERNFVVTVPYESFTAGATTIDGIICLVLRKVTLMRKLRDAGLTLDQITNTSVGFITSDPAVAKAAGFGGL